MTTQSSGNPGDLTALLDELDSLLAKASPRPFEAQGRNPANSNHKGGAVEGGIYSLPLGDAWSARIVETDSGVYPPSVPDADLICGAVNALPRLIAIARAAQRRHAAETLVCRRCDFEDISAECNCADLCSELVAAKADMVDALASGGGDK